MTDIHLILSLALDATTLLTGLAGILVILRLRDGEPWSRRFCLVFFSVLVFKAAMELLVQLAQTSWNVPLLVDTCTFLDGLASVTLNPLLVLYLLHNCAEQTRKNVLWKLNLLLSGVSVLLNIGIYLKKLLLTAPAQDGSRPPDVLALIYIVITLIALISVIFAVIRRRKLLTRTQLALYVVYFITPFLALIFLVELLLLLDQGKRYAAQKDEIARQKASLAVLQMRPHFIYNTMSSIYYLIEQDAPKAQQVTKDFTNYLRKNFTAIAKEETIPFTEELEHTKAYLSVEQVRFEGRLFVEFDTPCMNFRLPPLTLQPIVENAVKHGVDPDLRPLCITVRTLDRSAGNPPANKKTGVEITVEDNGPGFSEQDDNEPHIALANIRERLERMCKGTLEISPSESGGTRVSIILPGSK